MNNLFTPISLKGLTLKNRVVMPPMCQFSIAKKDGVLTDWHYLHYVSRAIGGVALVIIEMSNVEPDGRITDYCSGLWSDEQIEPLKRIVDACHSYGAKVAIQIGHAGRKAEHAKEPVAPSAIPFSESAKVPRALTTQEVGEMVEKYRQAAKRALAAGVDSIEVHGAHGYLIHQFQSPLTNHRDDEYGKDKTLFGREVIRAIKQEMPPDMPLILRISAIEYVAGGYDLEYAVELCKAYRQEGVDVFHVSSGGEGPLVGSGGQIGTHAGYQVPLARRIKEATGLPTIAVGKLEAVDMANSVIGNEDADLAAIGRGLLRNPHWTIEAAIALGQKIDLPFAYERAFPKQK